MSLRIGVEVSALRGQRTGVGNYVDLLGRAMLQAPDSGCQLVYYDIDTPRPVASAAGTPVGTASPSRARRWLWTQLRVAALAQRDACDILHCPNAMGPLYSSLPLVLTIADLSLFRLPHCHPRSRVLFTRSLLPALARRAAAIIALSEFTRDEIIRVLRIAPEKVRTIRAAAAGNFRPEGNAERLAASRSRWRLPERFALFVGTIEPRKNLSRLLRAFRELRAAGFGHHLVLAGKAGWRMRGFENEIQRLGLTDAVHLLGYVPDADLPALFSLAEIFVFPSLYEGFGLPVLEAMACGTPVLSSKTSALPEVCGDAAHLVDPENTDALAQAMATLLSDAERRAELRRRGLARARDFSWQRAAAETMNLYRKVALQTGRRCG